MWEKWEGVRLCLSLLTLVLGSITSHDAHHVVNLDLSLCRNLVRLAAALAFAAAALALLLLVGRHLLREREGEREQFGTDVFLRAGAAARVQQRRRDTPSVRGHTHMDTRACCRLLDATPTRRHAPLPLFFCPCLLHVYIPCSTTLRSRPSLGAYLPKTCRSSRRAPARPLT